MLEIWICTIRKKTWIRTSHTRDAMHRTQDDSVYLLMKWS
jgi:hypothetical protein